MRVKHAPSNKQEVEDPILALLKLEAESEQIEETKTPVRIDSSTYMVVSELSLNSKLELETIQEVQTPR